MQLQTAEDCSKCAQRQQERSGRQWSCATSCRRRSWSPSSSRVDISHTVKLCAGDCHIKTRAMSHSINIHILHSSILCLVPVWVFVLFTGVQLSELLLLLLLLLQHIRYGTEQHTLRKRWYLSTRCIGTESRSRSLNRPSLASISHSL